MERSLLRQLTSGTAWLSAAFLARATSTFGIVAILARSLSIAEMGFYFLLLQVATIASIFSGMGVEQGNQKFISEAVANTPGSVTVVVSRLNGIVFAATAGVLGIIWVGWQLLETLWFKGAPPIIRYFLLGMIAVMTVERIQSSMLRAMDKMGKSSMSDGVVRQCFLFLVLGILYLMKPERLLLEGVLTAWLLCSIAGLVLARFWCGSALAPYRKNEPEHGPSLSHMIGVSIPLGVASATAVLRGASDMLVIGWLMGPEMAGLFGPVKRVTTLVSALTPVTKMLQPMVAGLYAKNQIKELGALCRKASLLSTAVGLILVAFFVIYGNTLLSKVFGPAFAGQGPILFILVTGLAVRNYLSAAGVVLQMTGQHMLTMRVNILFCLFAIAALILAAQSGQLLWIACAASGTMVLQFILLSHLAQRHTGIRTYFMPFTSR